MFLFFVTSCFTSRLIGCSLTLTWFSWINIHVIHRQGLCQMSVYLSYVFSCLSVWTVVCFSVERAIGMRRLFLCYSVPRVSCNNFVHYGIFYTIIQLAKKPNERRHCTLYGNPTHHRSEAGLIFLGALRASARQPSRLLCYQAAERAAVLSGLAIEIPQRVYKPAIC